MSQSTLYGFAPNELKPGPDFTAGVDSNGKWTGSQTFTCRKFDFGNASIQAKIQVGNSVTQVYPELPTEWDFLYISSWRHEHQPGGITKVSVDYSGSSEDSPDPRDPEEKEESYSMAGSLTENDILGHPYFADISEGVERPAIVALIKGTGRRDYENPSFILVTDNYTGELVGQIDSPKGLKLYDLIFNQGKTTYLASQIEWTIQKSSTTGISDENLQLLGYIAEPEGNPPNFTDRDWLFTAATQNRTNANPKTTKTWSKTYTLSSPGEKWDPDLYNPVP
jgi:hypothetical protein